MCVYLSTIHFNSLVIGAGGGGSLLLNVESWFSRLQVQKEIFKIYFGSKVLGGYSVSGGRRRNARVLIRNCAAAHVLYGEPQTKARESLLANR